MPIKLSQKFARAFSGKRDPKEQAAPQAAPSSRPLPEGFDASKGSGKARPAMISFDSNDTLAPLAQTLSGLRIQTEGLLSRPQSAMKKRTYSESSTLSTPSLSPTTTVSSMSSQGSSKRLRFDYEAKQAGDTNSIGKLRRKEKLQDEVARMALAKHLGLSGSDLTLRQLKGEQTRRELATELGLPGSDLSFDALIALKK